MAISAEQAAQLASAYQSGDAGLQSLVNQMGVTQADVQQYFPGFDVSGAGLTLPGLTQTYGPKEVLGQDISNFIQGNLKDPRAIAQAASQFGLTSQDIAAATGYKPEIQQQYFNELIGPRTSNQSLVDFLNESVYSKGIAQPETRMSEVGMPREVASVTTPSEPTYGTEKFTADVIRQYIKENQADPTRIYQAAQQYGVTPEDLQTILKGSQYDTGNLPGLIQDYMNLGKSGYETRLQDIIVSTFGSEQDIALLEKDLGLQPGSIQSRAFDPTKFSSMSVENIEKFLKENPLNKIQEANRISRLAQYLYGASSEDANKLRSDLLSGKDTDAKAKEFYDELLKGGLTKDLQDKFLMDAATRAPGSKFFQDNPNVLTVYKPIDNIVASPKDSGQYGYYNDAPILSATEADKLLGNKTYVGGNNYFGYGSGTERDDSLGWDLRSKYAGYIANGAGVVGVKATEDQINEFDQIQKKINELGGERNGYVTVEQTDPETGRKFMSNVPVSDFFTTEVTEDGGSNGGENYKLYQETMNALNQGAQQLGLNPASFGTPSSLFKAVDDKLQNTYIVTGRANNWDEDVANRAGITGVGQSRGGVNHAQVLYERVGDKLIPVKTLKTFNFDDPNTSRGFIGDLAQGIASIPFVAELALTNPATAVFYPVIKGAQTLALGGDFEDALKAGGLAYLTTNFIPQVLSPDIQTFIAQSDLVRELAQFGINSGSTVGAELANFVTKAGSNAIISMGMAGITGQDPFEAGIASLLSSGVFQSTKAGLNLTDTIPDQYKPIVAKIVSDLILNQDPKQSLIGFAKNTMNKEIKDFIKTRDVLTDETKPTVQV